MVLVGMPVGVRTLKNNLVFFFKINFKNSYTIFTFTAITKYWLYFPGCTTHPWAYLTLSSLCLDSPTPILPPISNHKFVLCICELACFLLYSLLCCIFQIPHISDSIEYLSFSVWLSSTIAYPISQYFHS